MSTAAAKITRIMEAERTFVRVYELPEKLTNGFCHGFGNPIVFRNVDWFEAVIAEGREPLARFIKRKVYYKPDRNYLVIGDHPDFTFRIYADLPAEVAA